MVSLVLYKVRGELYLTFLDVVERSKYTVKVQ